MPACHADVAHDLSASGWRMRELSTGIHDAIVHGQVLLEDGRHTGVLPGWVLRHWSHQMP